MPKGPLKTPFTDYVVPKGNWKSNDLGVAQADGDWGDMPVIIGVNVDGQPTPELLNILKKG